MSRELILLSPYRPPTQHSLILNEEDVANYLNGYAALWHPAVLRQAGAPPRVASPYDHENPQAGQVFAVPVSPPLYLPDDWEERVRQAGAACFRSTGDRGETLANLRQAMPDDQPCPDSAPFFGLGLGYLMLDPLFEAMSHAPQLNVEEFWATVLAAARAAEDAEALPHLQAAAQKLLDARSVVYPANVYLVDFVHLADPATLRAVLDEDAPVNVIVTGQALQNVAEHDEALAARLRDAVQRQRIEVCASPELERPDALLPIESQAWNLARGQASARQVLGEAPRVFARRDFSASPQLPSQLHSLGITKAVLLEFDEGVLPHFRAASIEWTGVDGKRVDAFTRKPLPAHSPLTYFHLAHHLYKTMLNDMTACLAFTRAGQASCPFHQDWSWLNRLAAVYGQRVTLDRFFVEVAPGEYPAAPRADAFHSDYLDRLTTAHEANPVSRFRDWTRGRRRIDDAWMLAALWRGLSRQPLPDDLLTGLAAIEDRFERGQPLDGDGLAALEARALQWLADRLLARATEETSGHLLLNTFALPRRAPVVLEGVTTPLPAPARATELMKSSARAVVDLPPLGFAWLPNAVAPGTKVPVPKGALAEQLRLRNEFFEAEIMPETGGLRVIRDHARKQGRFGQQLVFNPGSVMQATRIVLQSRGPALGEVVTEGELVGEQGETLARFRQRYRAWWAVPWLELQITLEPVKPPAGYPWHHYFGCRFAWRDPRTPLFAASGLILDQTGQTRPESPDLIELRDGPHRTAILLGGLPFLQRQGSRMLDVVFIVEGETARTFDLAIGVDLEEPVQAALDFITPPRAVAVAKGPPHVGASGWLFHLDSANVVLTSLRPAADGADAVVARLVECRGIASQVRLHCPRHPTFATLVDEAGTPTEQVPTEGDAVSLYFAATEMKRIRVEFG